MSAERGRPVNKRISVFDPAGSGGAVRAGRQVRIHALGRHQRGPVGAACRLGVRHRVDILRAPGSVVGHVGRVGRALRFGRAHAVAAPRLSRVHRVQARARSRHR